MEQEAVATLSAITGLPPAEAEGFLEMGATHCTHIDTQSDRQRSPRTPMGSLRCKDPGAFIVHIYPPMSARSDWLAGCSWRGHGYGHLTVLLDARWRR
eukprot:COSAG02_NODE_7713_length_2878_cov_12.523929_1_plen_98_part_00